MNLVRFKQIHSSFHPENGASFFGCKFHQLHYLICMFNDKAKIVFVIGEHGYFDEGLIVSNINDTS